jgi:hypothetical protein
MFVAVLCLALAALAAIRAVTQGMWNREHTGEGFFGYKPTMMWLNLATAAVAGVAGIYMFVRFYRRR